jgi:hypothetical protein
VLWVAAGDRMELAHQAEGAGFGLAGHVAEPIPRPS